MPPNLLQWTDQAGISHPLRPAQDLSSDERRLLDILRQQVRYAVLLLDSGFNTPGIAEAPPNMVRMMLRILLPSVAEQEIATFDPTIGHDLLSQWWATTDASA
jgi:hypothetical protein